MSYDMIPHPHSDDPHAECNLEIHRLQAELTAVRSQAQKDNMRADLCDTYAQWLLDIGKLIGCGHLDERLPRCIEEEFWKLKEQVNALIDSCYYRTKAGKVHWKQGQHFGTSIADNTEPEAFLEAVRAIRHNAGIPDDDLGGEDEAGSYDPPRKSLNEPREQLEGYDCHADFCAIGDNTAQAMTCANCGEVSTNPGQFLHDGRWVCTKKCRNEMADTQSYDDLAASGGIVDAP
jgi:hypothetical protein